MKDCCCVASVPQGLAFGVKANLSPLLNFINADPAPAVEFHDGLVDRPVGQAGPGTANGFLLDLGEFRVENELAVAFGDTFDANGLTVKFGASFAVKGLTFAS